MNEKMLERCRAVQYMRGPAGRKGARKCAECGFYFVPSSKEYPFYNSDAIKTKGIVYHSGLKWYEETGCCPNCEPYKLRRCLGRRQVGGHWDWGCGLWFSLNNEYSRQCERRKQSRRKVCPDCYPKAPSDMRERLLKLGDKFVEEMGRAPTGREWSSRRGVISAVFGSWNNYVSELGEIPRQPGGPLGRSPNSGSFSQNYTEEDILKSLKREGEEAGRALTIAEWKAQRARPSASTVIARLGSWRNAWLMVGQEPHSRLPKGAWKKAVKARYGADALRKAYEICNDPDSEFNRQLRERIKAHERFEQGKFRKAEA